MFRSYPIHGGEKLLLSRLSFNLLSHEVDDHIGHVLTLRCTKGFELVPKVIRYT